MHFDEWPAQVVNSWRALGGNLMKDLSSVDWESLLSDERKSGSKRRSIDISPFNLDYNKAVFSSAFRRLQHKTQVFPLERLDYVRSRLTHSLEVDAIAKNIIQYFFEKAKLKDIHRRTFPVPQHSMNILSAASLLHDIGNPPFGHHGEEAIRSWFTNPTVPIPVDFTYLEDYKRFDGNCQGFRVITKLQIEGLQKPSYGLDFTAASIATLCKTVNTASNISATKIACIGSEEDIFDWAFTKCGLKIDGRYIRHPLSYIMEAADDIANCASDLEDAIKKRVLEFDGLMDLVKSELSSSYNHYLYRSLKTSLEEGRKNGHPDPVSVALKQARSEIQSRMTKEVCRAFTDNFDDLMSGSVQEDLISLCDKTTIDTYNFLKDSVAKEHIYKNKGILKKEISGDVIIKGLLQKFIGASLSKHRSSFKTLDGKLYSIISDNFKYVSNKDTINDRIQLVVDYISGMTDTFAYDMYQELSGIS